MSHKRVSIGIDVGGTKIAGGLIDSSGHILSRHRYATRPAHLARDLEAVCAALLHDAQALGRTPIGVGVGLKGAVDRVSQHLVHSIYLGQSNLPVGQILSRATGLPIWLENDVHAATIGELVFGVGRECADFVLFNAGTGISIGIVTSRRLFRGASGVAGENGHISMDQSGRYPCPCGLSGCMETIILRSRTGEVIPPLSDLAGLKDSPGAAYEYVLAGLVDVVTMLHPQAVALAGGMVSSPGTIAWFDRCARRLAPDDMAGIAPMTGARGGSDTGVLGAGALAFRAENSV